MSDSQNISLIEKYTNLKNAQKELKKLVNMRLAAQIQKVGKENLI